MRVPAARENVPAVALLAEKAAPPPPPAADSSATLSFDCTPGTGPISRSTGRVSTLRRAELVTARRYWPRSESWTWRRTRLDEVAPGMGWPLRNYWNFKFGSELVAAAVNAAVPPGGT